MLGMCVYLCMCENVGGWGWGGVSVHVDDEPHVNLLVLALLGVCNLYLAAL